MSTGARRSGAGAHAACTERGTSRRAARPRSARSGGESAGQGEVSRPGSRPVVPLAVVIARLSIARPRAVNRAGMRVWSKTAWSMNFRSIYKHGFVRVASCTGRIAIADPPANAEVILRHSRACHDEGVGLALFPELNLTGYSIEDLLLPDAVLDGVEAAIATVVEGSAGLLPVLAFGAPLRHRNRIYNCAVVVHRGRVLGVVPKSYRPNYREFYERRQIGPGDDQRGTIRVAGAEVPFGPNLLFAAEDVPGLV